MFVQQLERSISTYAFMAHISRIQFRCNNQIPIHIHKEIEIVKSMYGDIKPI